MRHSSLKLAAAACWVTGGMLLSLAAQASATGWSKRVTLSDPRYRSADSPVAAVDAAGDEFVAFNGVAVAVRPAGGSFSPPRWISAGSEASGPPRIAVDGTGRAVVAWAVGPDDLGDADGVEARVVTTAGPQGPPVRLTGSGGVSIAGGNTLPVVNVAAGGSRVVVVWAQQVGAGRSQPFAAVADAGSGFSPPIALGPSVGIADTQPNVAVSPAGEALATWRDSQGVVAADAPPGGAFGAPFKLTGETASVETPTPALDRSGAAVVAWAQQTTPDGPSSLVAAVRDAGGDFTSTVFSRSPYDCIGQPTPVIDAAGDVTLFAIAECGSARDCVETVSRPAGGPFAAVRPLPGSRIGVCALSGSTYFEDLAATTIDRSGTVLAVFNEVNADCGEGLCSTTGGLTSAVVTGPGRPLTSRPIGFYPEQLASNGAGTTIAVWSNGADPKHLTVPSRAQEADSVIDWTTGLVHAAAYGGPIGADPFPDIVAPRLSNIRVTPDPAHAGPHPSTVLRVTSSERGRITMTVFRGDSKRVELKRALARGPNRFRIRLVSHHRPLPVGQYDISIQAVDHAGNQAKYVSRSLTIS